MADNVVLSAGTADGVTLAADDVGGVHYQRIKVSWGADNSAVDASAANPLPVVQTGTLNVGTVTAVTAISNALPAGDNNIGNVDLASAIPAGTNNIGDVDVLTVPADPFGANADAASATGSISAKLRFIAGTGIPVTGNVTVVNAGTFAVQAAQSGTWNVRNQDGSGNALTSATRGSERALSVQVVDGSGNQVTSFSGSGTQSAISTNNSTTAALNAAATFTGTADEITQYASITVGVIASHASATDGLSLEQSSDGTNWDIIDTYTVPATTGKTFGVQCTARYFRVRYTNGGTLQTSFRLQTILHAVMPRATSQRPQDALSNENDFAQTSAFLSGFNGTTWDRLRSVNTGYLGVTPHYAGTAASTGTGASGAQTQRVVTATDSTIGTVTTVSTVTNITNQGHLADDATFTPTTTRVMMAGFFADETATDSVDEGDGGAARMTLDRKVITTTYAHATAGGATPYYNLDCDETEDAIKASAGKLFWIHVMNLSNAVRYIKFYNATVANVTVGTTTPVLSFPIPTMADTNGAGFCLNFGDMGVTFDTAITVAAVTGLADNSTGAPGANEVVLNAGYI